MANDGGGGGNGEDDRDEHQELVELLNELRVVLPGIQVLFAFLLTIPFTGRFRQLSTFQDTLFAVSFVFAAFALVLLAAPTAYHRIRFRAGDEETMLRISNREAIVGLVCLAVSLESAVILVGDLIPFRPMAAIGGAVVGLLLVGLWFGLPLARAVAARRS